MSSISHKIVLLNEIIFTTYRSVKRRIIWKIQGGKFNYFGDDAVFEKPLYTRKLQYVSIGNSTVIKKGSRIQCDDEFAGIGLNPNLTIGDRCGIGYSFTAFVYDKMTIGNDVVIADNVMITCENHGMKIDTNYPFGRQPLCVAEVHIGNNVWLSKNVCVMPGVRIGDNVIVGANSVVTGNIPPNSIAVGAPARVIKKWDFESRQWERIR